MADPDSRRPYARRFAEAHKVQGVAVGCDPRLLVGAIAVDCVGQALSRRPILSGSGPLAALSDSVGDKDIGRPLHPCVAVVRKAGEVDCVGVRRDRRLVGAKIVVRRERQLARHEARGASMRPFGQDRGPTDSCSGGGY